VLSFGVFISKKLCVHFKKKTKKKKKEKKEAGETRSRLYNSKYFDFICGKQKAFFYYGEGEYKHKYTSNYEETRAHTHKIKAKKK